MEKLFDRLCEFIDIYIGKSKLINLFFRYIKYRDNRYVYILIYFSNFIPYGYIFMRYIRTYTVIARNIKFQKRYFVYVSLI